MAAKPKITVKPAVPKKTDRQANVAVKVATSNLFVLEERTDKTDFIADAILEDIGGQELINITRTDILNGQNVTYNIVSNLASLEQKFNPNSMIAMQGTDQQHASLFSFMLGNYIPEFGTAIDVDGAYTGETVYVDVETGRVVVNTINVDNNLRVEVEFVTYSEDVTQTYPLVV
jgi:hypothetical protein